MTGLREALAGYLELRRSMGFSLAREEKLLGQYVSWLEDRGAATVTTADALAWVLLPAEASAGWLKFRMQAVRGFAAHLASLDPATEIPPPGLLPGGPRRAVPYLYSPDDIASLLAQAGRLKTTLRQQTFRTLIGLMAVTGMRGGEVVALDDDDFEPGRGLLVVRHAKLGRHRLLPLHPATVTALADYRRLRDQRFPAPRSQALLVSSAGTRLFAFAALHHPEHAADIERVLAIPPKRADQNIITYLTDQETKALLAAPDQATRTGRRDHAWILLAIQTGLRASEITGLTCRDVHAGAGAYVACHGKGRKDRITPLTPGTVTTLRAWLAERAGAPGDPLFTTIRGGPLSHDALQQRLAVHAAAAARACPTLTAKNITPHVLRHTAVICTASAPVRDVGSAA
jgi:integrase